MDTPPIPDAGARHYARWLTRGLRRVRVVGTSMEPTLIAGDVVFVDTKRLTGRAPQDLDVVVGRHPQQPDVEIIKRVEFADEHGVYLRSDNVDSIDAADSRRFGMVPLDQLIGIVVSKVGRP